MHSDVTGGGRGAEGVGAGEEGGGKEWGCGDLSLWKEAAAQALQWCRRILRLPSEQGRAHTQGVRSAGKGAAFQVGT